MEEFKKLFYDLKSKAEQKRSSSQVIGKFAHVLYELYVKTRPNVRNWVCLDIGVGTGWAMHSLLADGCHFCDGIDISSERIAQTDSLLKKHGFSNYTLRLADAENLDHCDSDHYDYVNYLDILEHLPNYRKAIQEVHRVLKKGGLVYVKTPNNYTDSDLQLHHYCQTLCALFLPEQISPPGRSHRMLMDDIERLTADEQEKLAEIVPDDFQEHIHQFYPNVLVDFLCESGFDIVKLTGTPVFTDIIYNNQSMLQNFAETYATFLESGAYKLLAESLLKDLLTSKSKPSFEGLPAEYVFSDNLIVLARKT